MIRLIQSKYFWVILLLISLVWTFLLYFRVISFDFVNWDDNAYVYQNKDITELSIHSVYRFFSSFYLGMYQPLTMLSFAIEYYFYGLDPSIFHATNLILHLLNVCFVFIFIRKLTTNNLSAFIVSLFFGIHPLHVESVAWISERKDVLYTFFYLAALISYSRYLKVKKTGFWILSAFLFVFSLLSKSAAVTFPLILLLLHFYHQKDDFNFKNTLFKVWPFFLLSIIFGLISFISQKTFNSIDVSNYNYSQFNRIIISGFAFFTYILHLVYPTVFSAAHPFPIQSGYILPIIYYFYFTITLIILYLCYYFYKRGSKNQLYYDILFGFLFFTFTIFLILYNPASKAVYADRYTYLPYIGLFLILSGLIQYLIDKSDKLKYYNRIIVLCIVMLLGLMYSINTNSFISNWANDTNLWNKTTENEPSAIAYFCRAVAKKEHGDVNGAIKDYQKSISYNDHFYESYTNIAAISIEQSNFSEALIYLNKVLCINPSLPEAHYNRGFVYRKLNKIPESIIEFTSAIKLNSGYGLAYYSRASAFASLIRFEEAFKDVNQCINIEPLNYQALSLRGYLLYKNDRLEDAMKDLNKAIELKPDYILAYNNRSLVFKALHDYNKALMDLDYAIIKEPDFANARFNRAKIYLELNDKVKACKDLQIAYKGGIAEAGRLIDKKCR